MKPAGLENGYTRAEIRKAINEGQRTRDIALDLGISVSAVNEHIRRERKDYGPRRKNGA